MVLTRQDAKVAFNHVLDNVIGCGDNSPLKFALQQDNIEDIFALVTMDNTSIDSLTYNDPSNASSFIPVSQDDKNLVCIFRDYVIHRNNSGNPINDQWTSITQADFAAFATAVGATFQPLTMDSGMLLTLSQAKDAFNHILDVIFEQGDGTPLKSALLEIGISDILGLISIDNDTINRLTYADPKDHSNRICVKKGVKSLVSIFQCYVLHCSTKGTPIKDWLQVTQEDFDEFRVNPTYVATAQSALASGAKPTDSFLLASPQPAKFAHPPTTEHDVNQVPSMFPTIVMEDKKLSETWQLENKEVALETQARSMSNDDAGVLS